MAVNRYYSSTAVDTTLAVGISSTATSMVVASVTGFPASYPYTLAIDYDTSTEELVNVVGASGTTLTLGTTVGVADVSGRGVDQGEPYRQAHSAGAVVKHVISGRDVREPQEHIAATTNVHGIADTSTLITASSTTTMTNKSLTAPVLTGIVDSTAGTIALGTTGSITTNGVTVSAAELGYVDGVTSNIQTQLGTKAPIASPTFTGTATIPDISATTLSVGSTLSISSSGNLAMGSTGTITANSLTVSAAEVSYLDGVTSSVQTQIDGKLTIPTSWTTWTPTWGGTGASAGNATVDAKYSQVGKTVNFRLAITYAGTSPTSSFGSTGVTFTLPSTPGNPVANFVAQAICVNGTSRYCHEVLVSTAGTLIPLTSPTTAGAASRNITSAIPFAWGASDQLIISGTYEAA